MCAYSLNNFYFVYLQSLALSKQLIRSVEKDILHAVNAQECRQLLKTYVSDECKHAAATFFQKKSKL